MKCALLLLLAVTAFLGAVRADVIDDYVHQEMERQRIPGLALAIIRDGEILRAQGYGLANLEHSVPVRADTVFQSGSLGKQFTAMAVMLLVEDGKLSLDESLRTWLPEAPVSWDGITPRHLLNHTSGLPDFDETAPFDYQRDYDDAQLLRIAFGLTLKYPAGRRWDYSNTGYVVLGILVKRAGGEFYGDVLMKRVFTPLRMRTARIISERELVSNRASGYELEDGVIRNQKWVSPSMNRTADGSLYLSVLDMAEWDAGVRGRKILKPESWAEIGRPAGLTSGRTYPYGFGWTLRTTAGREAWSHGGSWQGFKSYFVRYLGDGLSIALFANLRQSNPSKIVRGVAALHDPKFASPKQEPITDVEPGVAARVQRLIGQAGAGTLVRAEFQDLAESYFKQTVEYHRKEVAKLGQLRTLALYSREHEGDDTLHRYRASGDKGFLEATVTLTPEGRILRLVFRALAGLDAPYAD